MDARRHKARVFESVLGIGLTNRDALREAILRAAATSDEAEGHGDNGHGTVYSLRFPMRTPKGAATVVTAWIVRNGEDFPRLTTCYILQTMSAELLDHDLVALLEDASVRHFRTGEPLLLRRGQLGTVVMVYEDGAVEVEFADRDGRPYALVSVSRDKVMLLRDAPEHAVA